MLDSKGGFAVPLTSGQDTNPTLQSREERIGLARDLYREFHALCFWNSPRDLEITEDLIPFVAKGLRARGGHAGFALASKLMSNASQPEAPECP